MTHKELQLSTFGKFLIPCGMSWISMHTRYTAVSRGLLLQHYGDVILERCTTYFRRGLQAIGSNPHSYTNSLRACRDNQQANRGRLHHLLPKAHIAQAALGHLQDLRALKAVYEAFFWRQVKSARPPSRTPRVCIFSGSSCLRQQQSRAHEPDFCSKATAALPARLGCPLPGRQAEPQ